MTIKITMKPLNYYSFTTVSVYTQLVYAYKENVYDPIALFQLASLHNHSLMWKLAIVVVRHEAVEGNYCQTKIKNVNFNSWPSQLWLL